MREARGLPLTWELPLVHERPGYCSFHVIWSWGYWYALPQALEPSLTAFFILTFSTLCEACAPTLKLLEGSPHISSVRWPEHSGMPSASWAPPGESPPINLSALRFWIKLWPLGQIHSPASPFPADSVANSPCVNKPWRLLTGRDGLLAFVEEENGPGM